VADRDYNIHGYTALYFAAHMINLEWVQHRSGVHQLFPSSTDVKDDKENVLVTSYAIRRPDGNWSLMLVNRDQNNAYSVRVVFDTARQRQSSFSGPVTISTFGSEQYVWKDEGPNSHAEPDGPPVAMTVDGNQQALFTLPKASITVLRGKVNVF
jgi:hypothetical protein